MTTRRNTTPRPELARLQSWMQTVITHPGGVLSGVASDEARRSLDVTREAVEQVVVPSSTLTGAQRLAIYSRSYHARLLQCFESMFPALRHALGEDLFKHFALDYLQRHPPHSYTLDDLADDFPQHLAETRPDAEAPPGERESWPDFIVELATLESAFLKVFDGAGVEGRKLPDGRDILSLTDQEILCARPVPAPCLRLFAFRYPVHTYMLAKRRGESPALPAPAESYVVMTRRNFRVVLDEFFAAPHALLQALDGQHAVAQAVEHSARRGEWVQPSIDTVRAWLREWADKGFFVNVEISGEPNRADGVSRPKQTRKG